jgi:hypothetical protein
MKHLQVCVVLAALCICHLANSQTSSDIQILQATYGAETQQMDVTAKVESLVQSGKTNVRVGNHLFGKDPIFGKTKTLSVVFTSNGVQYRTDIREGHQLSFSNAHQLNVAARAPAPIAAAPTVQPDVSSPQREHHNLAPEGTFYLMEYVPIKSVSGVIGGLPGTRVKLVKDLGDTMRVKTVDEYGTEFEVSTDKLTNDIDLAAWAGKQDAQSQQALAQYKKEQMEAYREAKEKEKPIFDQQQRDAAERRAAAANAAKGNNRLDRGAYDEKESVPWWWHRHPYIYTRR